MDFLLKNLSWYNGSQLESGDVRVRAGIISEIGTNLPSKPKEIVDDFRGAFLYPGLINAHDHLEMNLYPKLGNPPYGNYVEWAKDIYHPTRSPLREIEKVKIESRLLWGGLKNLISGATSVVHHNPWYRVLAKKNFPVSVVKTSWAHSLALEKTLSKKIKRNNRPFVIHAAEGTDAIAFSEITSLHQLSALDNNTVLIHAVALTDPQIQLLIDNQSSVVWCPASNLYMFNRTAPIGKLKHKIRLSLGSDSTLTGSPTLLHEMKVASQTALASADEIYKMVTRIPAEVFALSQPLIAPGHRADLFVAPVKNPDYFENLQELQPGDISLVLSRGVPRMKNSLDNKWPGLKHTMAIQGTAKVCDVDVRSLKKEIQKTVPVDVLTQNPLWNLLEC